MCLKSTSGNLPCGCCCQHSSQVGTALQVHKSCRYAICLTHKKHDFLSISSSSKRYSMCVITPTVLISCVNTMQKGASKSVIPGYNLIATDACCYPALHPVLHMRETGSSIESGYYYIYIYYIAQ